jgi:hypothetical protein
MEALKKVPIEYGVELDLRPDGDRIIIHHDAFQKGEDFETFLEQFNHAFIILNTKAEGMEERLIELMQKHQITNYFFLDLSLPFLIKYMNLGHKQIAVRFSEYEPMEFVLNFAGKVDWVWVDCFNELPLNESNFSLLKKHFKICLVSPELQGHSIETIQLFKNQLMNLPIDAVCTKRPDLW